MDNRKKLKIFNVLYMRRLRVFFYFSCAGRIVTCYDDDDQISCGCICDLKIFAVFIELGTQGKFVFCSCFCGLKIIAVFIEHSEKLYLGQWIYLQCVLCTVFHHVYSCSIFSFAGRTVNCSDDDD